MGLMALFAMFTSYVAFQKPCREQPPGSSGFRFFVTSWSVATEHLDRWLEQLKSEYHQQIRKMIINSDSDHQVFIKKNNNHNQPYFESSSPRSGKISQAQTTTSTTTMLNNDNANNAYNNPNPSNTNKNYKLEFRSIKDRRPVNAYEDDDDTMFYVMLFTFTAGCLMFCSNFLFFFNSRQHMIEWRN